MKTTPTQGFPYPDGTDYGNGARQLQDLAEKLEATQNEVDEGWLARRNPPTWIARRTSGYTVSPDPDFQDVVWSVLDADNTGLLGPFSTGSSVFGLLTAAATTVETWWIGVALRLTQGTTVGSERHARIKVSTFDSLTGRLSRQFITGTGFETTTGGEFIQVDGVVRASALTQVIAQVLNKGGIAIDVSAQSLFWATRIAKE